MTMTMMKTAALALVRSAPRRGLALAASKPMRQAAPPATSGKTPVVHSMPIPPAVAGPEAPLDDEVPGFRDLDSIPTNYELAAGPERYELLKLLRGQDPWEDLQPIVLSQPGSTKNPIVVRGVDPERYIGCTGFPADSHEIVWLTVRPHGRFDRCPHCGNVFKYIREDPDAHHH